MRPGESHDEGACAYTCPFRYEPLVLLRGVQQGEGVVAALVENRVGELPVG